MLMPSAASHLASAFGGACRVFFLPPSTLPVCTLMNLERELSAGGTQNPPSRWKSLLQRRRALQCGNNTRCHCSSLRARPLAWFCLPATRATSGIPCAKSAQVASLYLACPSSRPSFCDLTESGAIPSAIGGMGSLVRLDLHGNHLTGEQKVYLEGCF